MNPCPSHWRLGHVLQFTKLFTNQNQHPNVFRRHSCHSHGHLHVYHFTALQSLSPAVSLDLIFLPPNRHHKFQASPSFLSLSFFFYLHRLQVPDKQKQKKNLEFKQPFWHRISSWDVMHIKNVLLKEIAQGKKQSLSGATYLGTNTLFITD